MSRLLIEEGALLLAGLVPATIDHVDATHDCFRSLSPERYSMLSTGERAAHDLAYEMWIGDGPLSRYIINADPTYARTLIAAITVALGPVTLDLAP